MAGTINVKAREIRKQGADHASMIEVHVQAIADAASSYTFPTVILRETLPGMFGLDLVGFKLYSVTAYHGATGPTDASDLTITDVNGIDLLGARGTDLIDETSETSCCAGSTNTEMPMPITGPITITLTGNSVASAVVNLKLLFVE